MIDWHLNYYVERVRENPNSTYKSRIRETDDPSQPHALTTDEKKHILLNNIYGVDLDQQAVEVTKLSLLLKMLEGETASTATQYAMFGTDDQLLPDLANNIKWGNSLIGSDFYSGKQIPMFDDEEIYRVKAFDWDSEDGFGDIMRSGGFDAVLGNPPYVRPHKLSSEDKEYYWKQFSTFVKKADLYCCFIERGINLLNSGGYFGYIVSDSWLRLDSFEKLRRFLLDNTSINSLIDFTGNVFADAAVKTTIVLLTNVVSEIDHYVSTVTTDVTNNLYSLTFSRIPQNLFHSTYKSIFDLSIRADLEKIKVNMRQVNPMLGSMFDLSFGIKTGDDSKFLTFDNNSENHKKLLRGENVQRYQTNFVGEYVWYVTDEMKKHRKTARPGTSARFEQPKVLIRDTGEGLQGTFDGDNYYVKDVLIISNLDKNADKLIFLIGVLNSLLMRFYYETSFPTLHVQRNELATLPICTINFDNPDEVAQHYRMVELVQAILDLYKQLPEATGAQKRLIEQQIARTNREIDALVYELYRLTDEEIAIVEESN